MLQLNIWTDFKNGSVVSVNKGGIFYKHVLVGSDVSFNIFTATWLGAVNLFELVVLATNIVYK